MRGSCGLLAFREEDLRPPLLRLAEAFRAPRRDDFLALDLRAPRSFCSSAFVRLHSCVRRIRTATSFCHFLIYWTSWLQPWEGSV